MKPSQLPCNRLNYTIKRMWDPNTSDVGKEKSNLTKSSEACGSVSVAFPLTMMITGMVGNALAILLVCRSYKKKENKRKQPFLLCIGSLALTDLTGQLLTSPIVIAVYLSNRQWSRVDPSGHLCVFFGLCMTMFGLCPLFIASAMAIERMLAIRTPHWYSSHMKTRATKTVLLCIWIGVFAFAMMPLAGAGQYLLQWPGTWCFISTGDSHIAGNTFFATTFASLGLTALFVTFACNLATIKTLIARCKNKTSAFKPSKQWERITMETMIQLMGIMSVLFACWSPLLVIMLKMISNHTSVEHCKRSSVIQNMELQKECNLFLTAVRLASLNQILDPWVYLLLRKILLRKVCQVANAVSSCSKDRQKGEPIILEPEISRQKLESKVPIGVC
ncbi:prostaglandin E2 receptor EP3 subtype [Microcaecilia unicolor]|uniref:Prostaglandin E2 receptor EP3 subtype n=1 Tax=Microcaecilia unicolor TaxID=1415580 RepID=A0A6P7YDA2_9AMPH|nr:prostaglandin E2 receptor EP3 subtype [Microcaecilia unicolor]